jgi:hypothetical protein
MLHTGLRGAHRAANEVVALVGVIGPAIGEGVAENPPHNPTHAGIQDVLENQGPEPPQLSMRESVSGSSDYCEQAIALASREQNSHILDAHLQQNVLGILGTHGACLKQGETSLHEYRIMSLVISADGLQNAQADQQDHSDDLASVKTNSSRRIPA